jgi:hypothetical protein
VYVELEGLRHTDTFIDLESRFESLYARARDVELDGGWIDPVPLMEFARGGRITKPASPAPGAKRPRAYSASLALPEGDALIAYDQQARLADIQMRGVEPRRTGARDAPALPRDR